MFWQRGNGRHEEPESPGEEPSVDEPTWPELAAFDAFLRDREAVLRRFPDDAWGKAFPETVKLESLRAKLHRAWARRSS